MPTPSALPAPSGSSPLTRGKHGLVFRVGGHPGLIPAHAGKTPEGPRRSPGAPAHPRSRGENRDVMIIPSRRWGSSPLTRGKLVHFLSSHLLIRLIPAHAGKTRSGIPAPGRRRAHPRSRGENNRSSRQFLPVYGSSPLTRGKPLMRAVAADRIRLIPAHAGKTQAGGRPHAPGAAHPRSRGEN